MTQPSSPPVWWFSRCSEGPWALDPEHVNSRTVPSSRWKGPEAGTRSSSTRRHGTTAEDWKRWVCWVGTSWYCAGSATTAESYTIRRTCHNCWVSQSWRVLSGSRAEPSRRHGPGLLPTPSMSWRVTGPWCVLKSLRPVNLVCPKHHCVIYGVQIRWSRKALGRRPPWIFPPQRRWMKGSSSCHWIWKTGQQSLPP